MTMSNETENSNEERNEIENSNEERDEIENSNEEIEILQVVNCLGFFCNRTLSFLSFII